MKLWIVTYTHRHGADVWPRFAEDRPSEEAEIEELRNTNTWEGNDRGDFLEISGPFDLPANPDTEVLRAYLRGLRADLESWGFDSDSDGEIDGSDFIDFGAYLYADLVNPWSVAFVELGLPVTPTPPAPMQLGEAA